MSREEEIQIAFNMWELMNQLQALMWDQYFEEFNHILFKRKKECCTDLDKHFPFK